MSYVDAIYAAAVNAGGTVEHLPVDGNGLVDRAGSFDLTAVGATLAASGGPGAAIMGGGYWSLDGVNDCLYAASPAVLEASPTAVTVAHWAKVPVDGIGATAKHWSKGDASGSGGGLKLEHVSTIEDRLAFKVRGGGTGSKNIDTTPTLIPTGQWVLHCCTIEPVPNVIRYRIYDPVADAIVFSQTAAGSGYAANNGRDWVVGALHAAGASVYSLFLLGDIVAPFIITGGAVSSADHLAIGRARNNVEAAPVGQDEAGGSIASVTVATSGAGAGSEAVASGSVAAVTVVTSGAGFPVEVAGGGYVAGVTVATSAAGVADEVASGGAFATVTATASSGGYAVEAVATGAVAVVTVYTSGGGSDPSILYTVDSDRLYVAAARHTTYVAAARHTTYVAAARHTTYVAR